MGTANKVRNDLGASGTLASFLEDVAELAQLSQKSVAEETLGRTVFAFRWQRVYIHLGADLRMELVNALALN